MASRRAAFSADDDAEKDGRFDDGFEFGFCAAGRGESGSVLRARSALMTLTARRKLSLAEMGHLEPVT